MSKHYHLIGIGGIGMSAIAQLLLKNGCQVSGSDVKESAMTMKLREQGAHIYIGHSASNIQQIDTLIYSSAITQANPEMQEAKRKGIVCIKRGQALAKLMQDKKVITVTGSHGKTTTSSLAAYLLLEAGLSPSVAVGGNFKNINTNALAGDGDFFVAEADESDGSFLYYEPMYSIITNIDHEHLDYYKSFDNVLAAFDKFIAQTAAAGCLFCCGDDKNLRSLVKDHSVRHVLFGMEDTNDIYPRKIKFSGLSSCFECVYQGRTLGEFCLSLAGKHNISNALSIIALGSELDIPIQTIGKVLAGYKGAGRRMDVKLDTLDVMVIDDYAHHPTEIQATLAAVKEFARKRIIAVFQPHRYSRTQLLMQEFSRSFDSADMVILTDIYAASEQPIPGVDVKSLYAALKENSSAKAVEYLPKKEIVPYIHKILEPQDVVIILGAGDIVEVSGELVKKIRG